jgi:hypothetical protein
LRGNICRPEKSVNEYGSLEENSWNDTAQVALNSRIRTGTSLSQNCSLVLTKEIR